MKTLLQLVHQYKGDVEQRIKCIKYDWENADDAATLDEGCIENYESQIAHWQATLKQIDSVLNKYDEAIQIKLTPELYEWVCPECSRRNEGSGIDEEVVCSGCSKLFKIKFV